jgi:hypothetical protein
MESAGKSGRAWNALNRRTSYMNLTRNVILGVVFAMLLCVVPKANAVDSYWDKLELRARAGAYFPTEKVVKDLSDVWGAIGLDIAGPGLFGKNSETVLSFDLYNRNWGRGHNTVFPIILGENFTVTQSSISDFRLYVGVGVGMVVGDVGGPSNSKFAARAVVGLDLTDKIFLEGSYLVTDRFNAFQGTTTTRGNGLTAMLGYKF